MSSFVSRRTFLNSVASVGTALVLPGASAALRKLDRPVRLGMITDLHQDIMHDAQQRLDVFLAAMQTSKPDAILQLGDFATPKPQNQPLIDSFNRAHERPLHVLGNHDIDGGFTYDQVMASWKMRQRYYSVDIQGLQVIVLDGNDVPPGHTTGYPVHIGTEQLQWLEATLNDARGPVLIVSHQPLAGPACIDNAAVVQKLLGRHADRIVLCVNGHTHIDYIRRVQGVACLHLNSASYVWVGRPHGYPAYGEQIHADHPTMQFTCPYRDSLFATLTLDPTTGNVAVEGRNSEWVGPSPAERGRDKHPDLLDGEQIVPAIRSRMLRRIARPA